MIEDTPRATTPTDRRPCPLCKGKKTALAVDALHPDGTVENPRPAVCMICEGEGEIDVGPEVSGTIDEDTPRWTLRSRHVEDDPVAGTLRLLHEVLEDGHVVGTFRDRCDAQRVLDNFVRTHAVREAAERLLAFRPEGISTELRAALEAHPGYYSPGDETTSFLSEAFLYDLLGKEDARSLRARLFALIRAAGVEPSTL